MRKRAVEKNFGKPSNCTPQRTAYCAIATHAQSLSRRMLCARTLENCEIRRKDALEVQQAINHATPCKATRNVDTFETYAPAPYRP